MHDPGEKPADWIVEHLELYLLGELSEAQTERLEQSLIAHPDALREGVRAIEFNAMVREVFREGAERRGILDVEPAIGDFSDLLEELLRDEARAEADMVSYLVIEPEPPDRWEHVNAVMTRFGRYRRHLAGVAAALILATVLFFSFFGPGPSGKTQQPHVAVPGATQVATLVAQHDSRWGELDGGSGLTDGVALVEHQRLALAEGFARLRFTSGAEVIVEGPAELTLLRGDAVLLRSGKLVAHCPTQQSKGFVVRTPAANVVDLGTTFGVSHDDDTTVRVIDGLIAVSPDSPGEATEPTRMTSGQAVSVEAGSGLIEPDYAPTERFVSDWDAIATPPMLEGQIQFEASLPTALGLGMIESDMIQLFPEWSGLELNERAVVTFSQSGRHETVGLNSYLEPGTVVDSYIVHLDLPGDEFRASKLRYATVRFANPVLGVVAIEQHLRRSDREIGRKDCLYASMYPGSHDFGFDVNKHASSDAIAISEDRRTLTLELYGGVAIDQLRVLVEAGD